MSRTNVVGSTDVLQQTASFWSLPAEKLIEAVQTGRQGLTSSEARQRLQRYGHNRLRAKQTAGALTLLLAQFKSPLIIILVLAALLSFFLREPVDATIILGIVWLSGLLGFWQEKRAADEALRTSRQFDLTDYRKLDEVPYDFLRKRLSILVAQGERQLLITKGALSNVLEVCSTVEVGGQTTADIATWDERLQVRFAQLSGQGLRTLGLAYREVSDSTQSSGRLSKEDERELTFLGLLVFADPSKSGIAQTIEQLRELGIRLKVITGDNRHVSAHVAEQVYGFAPRLIAGAELHQLSDEALRQRASEVDVFAEVEPNQKERIILALKKAGHVVGYLGDGINDAPALHAADVGISVNNAVDVAKEAAAIVLLEKDLSVLVNGVREGRTTFANTLKYIFMTTSANFGNMFSMAGASLFLPFLPLLPKQILLNNFLTDFPAMAIATDNVDRKLVERPRRWDIKFIRDFMIVFGVISSVFDFLTFGTLLYVLKATEEQFRTGWFLESVITELLIVSIIRTWRPFHQSRMSNPLLVSTTIVLAATLLLPYSPLAKWMGFTPLPFTFLLAFGVITALYLLASEIAKKRFYRRIQL